MSIPPRMVNDSRSANMAGVSLPIVSMGFLLSTFRAHLANDSIGLGSCIEQASGSFAEPVGPFPLDSEMDPESIEITLVDSVISS